MKNLILNAIKGIDINNLTEEKIQTTIKISLIKMVVLTRKINIFKQFQAACSGKIHLFPNKKGVNSAGMAYAFLDHLEKPNRK